MNFSSWTNCKNNCYLGQQFKTVLLERRWNYNLRSKQFFFPLFCSLFGGRENFWSNAILPKDIFSTQRLAFREMTSHMDQHHVSKMPGAVMPGSRLRQQSVKSVKCQSAKWFSVKRRGTLSWCKPSAHAQSCHRLKPYRLTFQLIYKIWTGSVPGKCGGYVTKVGWLLSCGRCWGLLSFSSESESALVSSMTDTKLEIILLLLLLLFRWTPFADMASCTQSCKPNLSLRHWRSRQTGRGQSFQTFYAHNLQTFVTSYINCLPLAGFPSQV